MSSPWQVIPDGVCDNGPSRRFYDTQVVNGIIVGMAVTFLVGERSTGFAFEGFESIGWGDVQVHYFVARLVKSGEVDGS